MTSTQSAKPNTVNSVEELAARYAAGQDIPHYDLRAWTYAIRQVMDQPPEVRNGFLDDEVQVEYLELRDAARQITNKGYLVSESLQPYVREVVDMHVLDGNRYAVDERRERNLRRSKKFWERLVVMAILRKYGDRLGYQH